MNLLYAILIALLLAPLVALCAADNDAPGDRHLGEDLIFPGDAFLHNNTEGRVLVWSDQVTAPVAVRYAWADNPTCNLYNAAGLQASPFRTDAVN